MTASKHTPRQATTTGTSGGSRHRLARRTGLITLPPARTGSDRPKVAASNAQGGTPHASHDATTVSIRAPDATAPLFHATGHSGFRGSHPQVRCRFRWMRSSPLRRYARPQGTTSRSAGRDCCSSTNAALSSSTARARARCPRGRRGAVRVPLPDAWECDAAARLLLSTDARARWGRLRAGGLLVLVPASVLGALAETPLSWGCAPTSTLDRCSRSRLSDSRGSHARDL